MPEEFNPFKAKANYKIELASHCFVIIRDVGGADHPSVTSDVENVLHDLYTSGTMGHNERLFYYDSTGQLDEIVHEGGTFKGFRPGILLSLLEMLAGFAELTEQAPVALQHESPEDYSSSDYVSKLAHQGRFMRYTAGEYFDCAHDAPGAHAVEVCDFVEASPRAPDRKHDAMAAYIELAVNLRPWLKDLLALVKGEGGAAHV